MSTRSTKGAKAPDLSWLPPAQEWDFRSVTAGQCRVAAYWEYEREYIPVRLIQSGGAQSPAMPPVFRQAARELFPQAWTTLSNEQRAKVVESFPVYPALQVRKLREFLRRMPAYGVHPDITQHLLHHSFVIIPGFRVHGVEVVIRDFEKWARQEAKNYPSSRRAQAAELPFDTLKWLAVARLEAARNKVKKLTIEMARMAVAEYQRQHRQVDVGGVFPIYQSDGAWLKAKQNAQDCLGKSVKDPSHLLAELA
jgi:hypothetical protein